MNSWKYTIFSVHFSLLETQVELNGKYLPVRKIQALIHTCFLCFNFPWACTYQRSSQCPWLLKRTRGSVHEYAFLSCPLSLILRKPPLRHPFESSIYFFVFRLVTISTTMFLYPNEDPLFMLLWLINHFLLQSSCKLWFFCRYKEKLWETEI